MFKNSNQQFKQKTFRSWERSGFTILELSIVIIIMAILSTLITAALGPIREANRNTKRVADIQEMQQALALYYRDWGDYPTAVTSGQSFVSGSNTYMLTWPSNPTPHNDGSCADAEYSYSRVPIGGGVSYSIQFCISKRIGNVGAGTDYAIPGQILSCVPNCIKSCGSGSNGCGGTCTNIASCSASETCTSDHCIPN